MYYRRHVILILLCLILLLCWTNLINGYNVIDGQPSGQANLCTSNNSSSLVEYCSQGYVIASISSSVNQSTNGNVVLLQYAQQLQWNPAKATSQQTTTVLSIFGTSFLDNLVNQAIQLASVQISNNNNSNNKTISTSTAACNGLSFQLNLLVIQPSSSFVASLVQSIPWIWQQGITSLPICAVSVSTTSTSSSSNNSTLYASIIGIVVFVVLVAFKFQTCIEAEMFTLFKRVKQLWRTYSMYIIAVYHIVLAVLNLVQIIFSAMILASPNPDYSGSTIQQLCLVNLMQNCGHLGNYFATLFKTKTLDISVTETSSSYYLLTLWTLGTAIYGAASSNVLNTNDPQVCFILVYNWIHAALQLVWLHHMSTKDDDNTNNDNNVNVSTETIVHNAIINNNSNNNKDNTSAFDPEDTV